MSIDRKNQWDESEDVLLNRDLLVVALQVLHQERVTAYQTACTACDLAGLPYPERVQFGISEVTDALRKLGAQPV